MKQTPKRIQTTPSKTLHERNYKQCEKFKKREPDLYIIFGDKIYPAHKEYVKESKLIKSKLECHQNVIIFELEIEASQFEGALQFLYGLQQKIQRDLCGTKMLIAAVKLQIQALRQFCLKDIYENFEEYSLFDLYNVAIKFKIQELIQKCQQQFHIFQYEQINFNRLDMLSLPRQIFQRVIRNHQKLKANKYIVGLSPNEIKQAIEVYSYHNDCKFEANELMKAEYDCFQSENEKKQMQLRITKAQSLFNPYLHNSICSEFISKSCEEKKNSQNIKIIRQVSKLKNLNQKQQKDNKILQQDLSKLKERLSQKEQPSIFQEIQQRLKLVQISNKINDEKMEKLKKNLQQKSEAMKFDAKSQAFTSTTLFCSEKQSINDQIIMSAKTANPPSCEINLSQSFNQIPLFERNIYF